MEQFLQQLLNGLAVGGIYALVALGYTMVYGVLKLINFAHGDLFTIGAYLGLTLLVSCNMAGALNPVLEGDRSEWARLRVPLGNLVNRLVGGVIVLAALPWASAM